MVFAFSAYLAAFWFVRRGQRPAAVVSLAIATCASVALYLYHADSSLGLNF